MTGGFRNSTHLLPREAILAAGAFTALGTGAIYMWSIFNKPLMEEFGFSTSEVSMIYSLFLLASCFSSMLAGWLQRHTQPRFIVLGAGILFGLGWFCSGFADNLPMLYLFYSGFAGAGNGMLYNTIVAVVTKWFPDKRGLANGVCIGAIGLGPMIFAPAGNWLIETFDVSSAFHIVGVVWLVVYLVFSWLLYVPPAGWTPKGWSETAADAEDLPVSAAANATASGAIRSQQAEQDEGNDAGKSAFLGQKTKEIKKLSGHHEVAFSSTQMVKQPLFYVLFATLMVSSTSGLMVTGHASDIGQELAHLTASEGAIMVSVMAFGSFLGRFGFGFLSDAIGRYNALIISLVINAVVMVLLLGHATTFVTFLLAVSVVGACFGGTMSIVPAIVGDAFGSSNFGQNYSFVYPGYTVASFVGPMVAASTVEALGTYVPAFTVAGAISVIGIVFVFIAKMLAYKLEDEKAAMSPDGF
mgnify:FL=1